MQALLLILWCFLHVHALLYMGMIYGQSFICLTIMFAAIFIAINEWSDKKK